LLYEHSAAYFDRVHQDVNYEVEAERLERIISCRVPHASSLLDVGCGTGRHLEYLRSHYEVAGVDISEQLLAQARKRLPGVPLYLGDLRSFDLGRRFDVVTCLFSTIGYAKTRQGLHAAVATLVQHAMPRGVLLIEPWLAPPRGFRFAEAFDADPGLAVARAGVGSPHAGLFVSETHYLVARASGVEHFVESHTLGLFELDDYQQALVSAGLTLEYLSDHRGLLIGLLR
jgi:SAM-dependent methyltransferase